MFHHGGVEATAKRVVKPLAVVATVGMFLVLVMGATVTNTGSEHGCGRSWPLCHGQFIPQFAMTTLIEFSHRVAAGLETALVIPLAALILYLFRRHRELQVFAGLMVLFLFLQAGMGAWAVMEPQLSAVLALHFGISLVAFAGVLLTALILFELDGYDALRDRPIPRSFRRFAWGVTAYSYVVVYLGAYVRHTNADDACSGWPLCNGAIVPALSGKVTSAFAHRVAAGILVLAILALMHWSWRLRLSRPDLHRASLAALATVMLQALAGAAVVFSHLDIFSALAHAAGAGLLFGSLAYLCLHTLPRIARRPAVHTAGPDYGLAVAEGVIPQQGMDQPASISSRYDAM
jgi:cytochrome c oxidase assembly protein subunit 15